MKIYELLCESVWTDVAQKWSDQGNSIETVQNTINAFKELTSKIKLPDDKKNIQLWSKKSFDEFQQFVDLNVPRLKTTKNAVQQKINVSENQIIIDSTPEWLIVVPMDMETSQKLGVGTQWCTSTKSNKNHFNEFIFDYLDTLIYVISKITTAKYCIRFSKTGQVQELKDQFNKKELTVQQFIDETGFDPIKLIGKTMSTANWRRFSSISEHRYIMGKKALAAVMNNNYDKTKYYIEHGANIHHNHDAMLTAAVFKNETKIVNLLLRCGANLHANEDAALLTAINIDAKMVKLLLDHGANAHNGNIINVACIHGNLDIILLLLNHGATIYNTFALRSAVEFGQTHVVKFLLDYSLHLNKLFTPAQITDALKKSESSTVTQLLQDYTEHHLM